MGGLTARSACHQAEAGAYTCAPLIRHVLCLATPHLGRSTGEGGQRGGRAAGLVPGDPAAVAPANLRSDGVKDRRYGALVEQDWHTVNPDEFLRDRCADVPFLPHVTYYFIGTTVTARHEHPRGDVFLRFPSASGNGRRRPIPFEQDNGHHIGGLHHFDLLTTPTCTTGSIPG